ncbi:MAG: LETM1 domain-containing protein [Vicingaceae bacterium]|nr:LETM1 domain-containing protein [Vicingaceae bacterium]
MKSQDSSQDSFEVDVSIFEKDGKTEFSEKIKIHKEKTVKAFQDLVINVKTEVTETKVASQILVKYIKEGNVTKEEEKELRTQVYDLLKVLGIGVPFALIPGASLLLPFLIKIAQKKGVEILPTAFNESNKKA